MISAATIEGLEARKLEYILGARERSDAIVRKIVLENDAPFVPLLLERKDGRDAALRQTAHNRGQALHRLPQRGGGRKRPQGPRGDRRRARRPIEEGRQGADRQLRLPTLSTQARRTTDKTKGKDKDEGDRVFEIDAGKLAEEARFDGIFVLRTNANVTPLQAVVRYRDLLQVENLFLRTKAIMRTRPIFHSSDSAIRGHVFCSFLALVMQKYLDDLSIEAGVAPEWKVLLRDLDRLQQMRLQYRGADWLVRTDAAPTTLRCSARPMSRCRREPTNRPAEAHGPQKSTPKRRGRPPT